MLVAVVAEGCVGGDGGEGGLENKYTVDDGGRCVGGSGCVDGRYYDGRIGDGVVMVMVVVRG